MSKRKHLEDVSQSQLYRRIAKIRSVLQQNQAERENDAIQEELQQRATVNSEDDVSSNASENNEQENQDQHNYAIFQQNVADDISSDGLEYECNESHGEPDDSDHVGDPGNNDPDSSDSNNTDNDDEEPDIKRELAEWVVTTGISRSATASLLKILRKVPALQTLPRSRANLVQTEKEAIPLKVIPPGEYFHFGFENCLKIALCQTYVNLEDVDHIKVLINIDGVSLTKSSYSQFLPILGLASNLPGSKVFRIGIYHGVNKPASVHDYFEDFVNESIQIITNGIVFKEEVYRVQITGFVMDLPAKSFALNTKGHTGQCSCTKCVVRGVRIENRTTFFDLDCELRTDASFRTQEDPDHHNGESPLIHIPGVDMVKSVVIDPFHQKLTGATKNKLKRLHKESATRLSREVRNALSDEMGRMAQHMPWEFARKPRKLDYLDKYKGTELRLFLLYLCPVVLKTILNGNPSNEEHYVHFVSLHIAGRMLSKNPSPAEIDYCEVLLRNFVIDFRTLHGEVSITQNIHSLIHLANDVRNFGSLDNFSSFPFENENGLIRRELKVGNAPLKQIVKRQKEKMRNIRVQKAKAPSDVIIFSNPRANGPVADNCEGPYFKIANFHSYKIGVSHPNNCFMSKDRKIFLVENIAYNNVLQRTVFIGREFQEKQDLYEAPRRSSSIDIFEVSNLGPLASLDPNIVESKCVRIPLQDKFAVLPLLHC